HFFGWVGAAGPPLGAVPDGFAPVAGVVDGLGSGAALPDGAGAEPGAVGAAAPGVAGAPPIGSGALGAGAVGVVARNRCCRSLVSVPPRGTSDNASASTREIPPHHQVALVSSVTACRPPRTVSVVAPPSEANPPPWP